MISTATPELESVEIGTENIVRMPHGLLGFEEQKDYVLLQNPEEAPFAWLQAMSQPTLAFLLVPPDFVIDDYCPDVSDQDTDSLDLEDAGDALIYNIVTLQEDRAATVNLKAPIVLNRFSLEGKQVVPENAAEFSIHHPLPVGDNL
ncbi:MAG: flagellar assembly factor FliW [Limisphaerales bacterium]|jgi:flagellar assembly factor FliW